MMVLVIANCSWGMVEKANKLYTAFVLHVVLEAYHREIKAMATKIEIINPHKNGKSKG